jgi:Gas vesicle synthesis protein GvpL/GvpF
MALYVYGIMRAPEARDAAARGEVALVEHAGLAALVSETPDAGLRLRRENVMAHSDVLQAAFEHGPVLPLRFGTVLAGRDVVAAQFLDARAEALRLRLEALEGKAELQVKATYSEEPLLRSILSQDARLAAVVGRIQQLPPAATHFERIRIGEAISAAIATRRARDGDGLMAGLRPLAVAVSVAEPHHERAMLNAAFLVERSVLQRFDKAVESASDRHAGEVEFKLIGPMPPYSFADHEWENTTTGALQPAWG